MIDIHCHLIPGIDDGPKNWDESLAMAQMAVDDGIQTIIATPHQLGSHRQNDGDEIRALTAELEQRLQSAKIPLSVLPGGDVRIEPDLLEMILQGRVLTLADHRQHVLLELPHELYFPLEPVLDQLARQNLVGVLSHPERNKGILSAPHCLPALVDSGCLMQITAGSLCGTFGQASQELAESMLCDQLVHFVATDAHGTQARRPLLSRARRRVTELTDAETAHQLFEKFPAKVIRGETVPCGRGSKLTYKRPRRKHWLDWSGVG